MRSLFVPENTVSITVIGRQEDGKLFTRGTTTYGIKVDDIISAVESYAKSVKSDTAWARTIEVHSGARQMSFKTSKGPKAVIRYKSDEHKDDVTQSLERHIVQYLAEHGLI